MRLRFRCDESVSHDSMLTDDTPDDTPGSAAGSAAGSAGGAGGGVGPARVRPTEQIATIVWAVQDGVVTQVWRWCAPVPCRRPVPLWLPAARWVWGGAMTLGEVQKQRTDDAETVGSWGHR